MDNNASSVYNQDVDFISQKCTMECEDTVKNAALISTGTSHSKFICALYQKEFKPKCSLKGHILFHKPYNCIHNIYLNVIIVKESLGGNKSTYYLSSWFWS